MRPPPGAGREDIQETNEKERKITKIIKTKRKEQENRVMSKGRRQGNPLAGVNKCPGIVGYFINREVGATG